MAGTKDGGKNAAETNRKLYGDDFYQRLGRKGGKAKNPLKGFGSDHNRASKAGILGGRRSIRKPRSVKPD